MSQQSQTTIKFNAWHTIVTLFLCTTIKLMFPEAWTTNDGKMLLIAAAIFISLVFPVLEVVKVEEEK